MISFLSAAFVITKTAPAIPFSSALLRIGNPIETANITVNTMRLLLIIHFSSLHQIGIQRIRSAAEEMWVTIRSYRTNVNNLSKVPNDNFSVISSMGKRLEIWAITFYGEQLGLPLARVIPE